MLTRSWGKALLIAALILVALAASAAWYRAKYSMDVARAFEVNDPRSLPRVLIASQGSAFKDAVVAGVVTHLETRQAYVKVIDISLLPGLNAEEWDAIAILHTWEMGKPPAVVQDFVDGARTRNNLVILTTSGRGDFAIAGVDVISSASRTEDVTPRVTDVLNRIDAILAVSSQAAREPS
jgi:hypothetical protein